MTAYVQTYCAHCGTVMRVVDHDSIPFKITCSSGKCPNVDKIFYAHMVDLMEAK